MIIISNKSVIFVLVVFIIAFSHSFSQAVSIENSFRYLKDNKYNEAISAFTNLIKQNDTISNFYYGRGVAYLYLDKYNSAIENFEKAIDININFVDAYYGLSIAYTKLGDYKLARTNIDKAIDIDSNYYELYYVRGILNYLEKKHNHAINDFNYILEHKNSLTALYGRAITFYKLGENLKSSADIEIFLQNNKTENTLINECYRLLKIIRNN